MAFFTKVGNILRQASSKNIGSDLFRVKSSVFQAVRCMSSSKVFIGGVSFSTDEQSLKEAFARYGEVIEARIIMDRETGRSRGFGFVTFTSSEEASSAIQALDGQELHGRRVKVNYANDRPRSNFGGDGYGGGGYGSGGGYGGGYGSGGGYGGGGYGGGGYGGYGGGGSNTAGGAPAYESNIGVGGGYDGGASGYGNTNTGGYGGGAPGYDNISTGGYGGGDNSSTGAYGGGVPGYGNTSVVGGGYNSNNEGAHGGGAEAQVDFSSDHIANNPSSGGFSDGSGDFNPTQGNFQDDDAFGKVGGDSRN